MKHLQAINRKAVRVEHAVSPAPAPEYLHAGIGPVTCTIRFQNLKMNWPLPVFPEIGSEVRESFFSIRSKGVDT